MLKRLSARERYESLIAEFEPILREIFLAAVADLRSGIALRVVIERLERQDIEGAMDALNLDRSAYSPLDEAIARAYSGGGRATVNAMPILRDPNGAQAVIRFDAQAYRAVQWLREHSLSEQMVRIDKEVARTVIADGLARGRGARRIGLDVAGRINRATGRREGGIIGLSEPQARAAWIEAINRIRSNIVLKRIIERLERRDIPGVIADLGIDEGAFAKFEQSLVQAYHSGGIATVDNMPALRDPAGNRILFSWGVRNLPAEQAMRDHAARLVTGIVTEARDGIASILTENLSRGQSPYDAARLVAGKVNRVNGTREGGLVGLSRPQMETVARIERAMRDGDVAYMRDYLTFANRDKRLDRTVMKAIREGRGLAPEEVERVARLYANKALKYRSDNIAIAETNTALAKAKHDAFQQQIDAGKLEAGDVTKTWGRTISREPRQMHLAMVGVTVPFDQPFTLPDGIQCTGPHDPNLPAAHRVGCKCPMPEYRIDFTGQALRRYRERTGG